MLNDRSKIKRVATAMALMLKKLRCMTLETNFSMQKLEGEQKNLEQN